MITASEINPDHLTYFKFVGRVIAMVSYVLSTLLFVCLFGRSVLDSFIFSYFSLSFPVLSASWCSIIVNIVLVTNCSCLFEFNIQSTSSNTCIWQKKDINFTQAALLSRSSIHQESLMVADC